MRPSRRAPVRLSRRFARASSAVAVLGAALCLAGFVRIAFNPSGPPLSWPASQQPVNYVINARGSADVGDGSDRTAVRLGFAAWERLADCSLAFVEDAGADAAREDFAANDIHLVVWDEDGSSGLFAPGSNIIALTPILASLSNGAIIDADIVFNGEIEFTTDPAAQPDRFDIQSVATHEVGHFVGLDHGSGPLTTMFSNIVAGGTSARALCRDDEAGAVTIYPGPSAARGRVAGSVSLQGAGAVRYGLVQAIDAATGEFAGGALTGSDGSFTLRGLSAGSYELYVEPADGPFHVDDTIAFRGQTASTFTTTWFPANPVLVAAGGQTQASWTVGPEADVAIGHSTGARPVAGGPPVVLRLHGSGLGQVASARVTGSGVAVLAANVLNQGAQLRLTLLASPGAARGVRSVELVGESGEVAILTAGVEVLDPPPTVSAASPAVLSAAGGDALTVEGTGFRPGADVVVGGQLAAAVTVHSPQRLTCLAPASPGTTQPLAVVVIQPDGQEARLAAAVRYELTPAPASVDPPLGPTAGGTRHVIAGQGFSAGAQVFFGGAEATVLSVTADTIEVRLPAQPEGTVEVAVRQGDAEGVAPQGFSYVDGVAPQVTSFAPTSGPAAGGTLVRLSGSGFAPDVRVSFGGVAATVLSAAPGEVEALTPGGATGAVEVRVTNPATGLQALLAERFTYGDAVAAAALPAKKKKSGCELTAPERAPRSASALLAALAALVLLRRRSAAAPAPPLA